MFADSTSPQSESAKVSNFLAGVSTLFAKHIRPSILLLFGIFIFGFLSYFVLLKREGFPSVEVPIAIVQTPYFVDDIDTLSNEITTPITEALINIKGSKQISSQTTENFSTIVIEFEENVKSADGADLVKEKLADVKDSLPEGAIPEVVTFNASQFGGKYDMVISLSAEGKGINEIQEKAHEIADELTGANKISLAETIDVVTIETNPITGETFENQESFNRVGYRKENGEFVIENGIMIGIIKKGDRVGTIDISDAVRNEVEKLEDEGILDGYKVSYSGDFATSLKANISSLVSNARDGMIFVLLIVFLLVSFRASIVTSIFIPMVMSGTFLALYLGGYSINVITLFGLVLILGLFVDDATVVVEAIDYQKKQGLKGLDAVRKAVFEVAIPDVTGTLTVILVFAPMLFVSGVLGGFIIQIPITVIIAMALSLIFALTLIPFLSNMIISDRREEMSTNVIVRGFQTVDKWLQVPGQIMNKIGERWAGVINLYLKYPLVAIFVVIPLAFALVIGSFMIAGKLKFNIFPSPKDSEEAYLTIQFEPGTTIEEAQRIASEVEDIIIDEKGEYVDAIYYYEAGKSSVDASVVLKPMGERDETSKVIAEDLQEIMDGFKDAEVKVVQSSVGPPVSDYPYQMQVYESDQEKLENGSAEIAEFLETVETKDGVKVVDVKIDSLDVISEIDNRRYALVSAKLSDNENTGAVLEIQEAVEKEFDEDRLHKIGLMEDALGFDLGQESENLESFEGMMVAFGFSIILMYILLVIQFNSFTQPLLVFLAIPLTFPGLFPGLLVTDNSLSFFVMIGIMGLAGIVVNNTIMLMDFANSGVNSGMSIRQAIVYAVQRRFRAILTTSTTTVLGLLPLALKDPFWEGLALAMVFGLISSSILVLTLFPAFYYVVENLRLFRNRLFENLRYMQFSEALTLLTYSLKVMITGRR